MANMKRSSKGEEEKALKFKCCGPPKPKAVKNPKANQLLVGVVSALPPPPGVREKFKKCELIVAIDVETHMLVQEGTKNWVPGQFGFKARVGETSLSSLRIVQLGWAIGGRNMDAPTVCDRVVKPDGFAISPEATQKHRLPHDVAVATGTPLREALRSMLGDVLDVCGRGGRLVAHHLERVLYRKSSAVPVWVT